MPQDQEASPAASPSRAPAKAEAHIKANPPIAIAELSPRLAARPAPGDEWLVDEELQSLSIFRDLAKKIDFRKTPGATYLWHGTPERVLFLQGDAGATAFYVVTPAEMLGLRRRQLAMLDEAMKSGAGESLPAGSYLYGMSAAKLAEMRARYGAEIARFERQSGAAEETAKTPVLAVHVLSANEHRHRTKGGWWRSLFGLGRRSSGGDKKQSYIPVDAPVAIDSQGRFGSIFFGDLFGEMSCMNRSPRSATVVVERECYVLEMARSVFESLHSDAKLKQRLDDVYRDRLLATFLERLALFEGVDRSLVKPLEKTAQLEAYPAGSVVFEQEDESDAVYVIRSGLAKVVENVHAKLRLAEFADRHWSGLARALAGAAEPDSLLAIVKPALPSVAGDAVGEAERSKTLEALNKFICQGAVPKEFGPSTAQAVEALGSRDFERLSVSYPEDVKNWSELERRLFLRALLETAFPEGIPKRRNRPGPMRTLAYRSQGDVIGEMGVVLDEPRSATCVAYDHPDGRNKMVVADSRSGAVPSQLELVKISRADFKAVLQGSTALKKRLDEIVERHKPRKAAAVGPQDDSVMSMRRLPEYEELGLVQGQRLMLIDLDRCTRCGECVKACVTNHDDGHARLHLDGPRFGDYLVPISCRSCLDPVCMIGCPVGAIHPGQKGEILIRDWCIGCQMCAKQCPYGSIQMADLTGEAVAPASTPVAAPARFVEEGVELKAITKKAVVCDMCASSNLGTPACVYACPHDAAIRVSGMEYSFER